MFIPEPQIRLWQINDVEYEEGDFSEEYENDDNDEEDI
jgi:hypothetical protein